MAAENNLSNELFFDAYRGLSHPTATPLGKNLGMHWTAQEKIAHELADRQQSGDTFHYGSEHRTIIHAQIPMSSVETDKGALEKGGVFSRENLNKNIEKEIPVKAGAPINVKSITKIYRSPRRDKNTGEVLPLKYRERVRTYKTPRQMTA